MDAASEQGETPLCVASEIGRLEMVLWLIERGASVNDVVIHPSARTALSAAAYGKRPDVAAALIAAGAELEAMDHLGNTPLTLAFINCFIDPLPIAKLSVSSGDIITDRVRECGVECNAAAFSAFLKLVSFQNNP